MSSNSCLVFDRSPSQTGHRGDSIDQGSNRTISGISRASGRHTMRNLEDSLQPSHIASTHYAARQSPRPVTDSGETSEEHSSEGVGPSHYDRNKDDDNGSDAAEQSDKNDDLEISRDSQETTKSLPQHQMEAFAELSLDAAMRCRRQKVILLSRLQESAQRGRLSQVR